MSYLGNAGHFGIAKQTVKGTPVASTRFLKCLDIDIKPDPKNIETKPEISPNARVKTDILAGAISWAGPLKAYLRPNVFPMLVVASGFSDSVSGAGPYTHTLTPTDALPWSTFEKNVADQICLQYIDAVMNDFQVKATKNDLAQLEGNILATTEKKITATSPTEETAPLLRFDQAVVTFDGGVTLPFENITFGFHNNCSNDEFVLGSRKLYDITPRRRDLNFEGVIKFDPTLYRKVYYGSGTATEIGTALYEVTNTTIVFTSDIIAGGATPFSVTITIPRMSLQTYVIPQGEDKPIWVPLKAEPLKASGSNICTIVVVNDIATQY